MTYKFPERIGPLRKATLPTIFGVMLSAYFTIASLAFGGTDHFNKAMIFIGFLSTLAAANLDRAIALFQKLPKVVRRCLKFCLVLFFIFFIAVEGVIVKNMKANPAAAGADYVIILGCQVEGTEPSIPLARRVDTALQYLRENRRSKAVVSGGRGPGEAISEAAAMKARLIQSGVAEDRILEEDRSASTLENLRFSDERHDLRTKNVLIVSSDYHLFRALSVARKLNYERVAGLSSPSPWLALPVYLLREFAAVVYYRCLGRI